MWGELIGVKPLENWGTGEGGGEGAHGVTVFGHYEYDIKNYVNSNINMATYSQNATHNYTIGNYNTKAMTSKTKPIPIRSTRCRNVCK